MKKYEMIHYQNKEQQMLSHKPIITPVLKTEKSVQRNLKITVS